MKSLIFFYIIMMVPIVINAQKLKTENLEVVIGMNKYSVPVGDIRNLNKEAIINGVKLGMKLKDLDIDTSINRTYNFENYEYEDLMMYMNSESETLENPRYWYRRKNENLDYGEIKFSGIYFGFINNKLYTIRGLYTEDYFNKTYLDTLFIRKYGIPTYGELNKISYNNPDYYFGTNAWVGDEVKLIVLTDYFEFSLKSLEKVLKRKRNKMLNIKWFEFWKKKPSFKYEPQFESWPL